MTDVAADAFIEEAKQLLFPYVLTVDERKYLLLQAYRGTDRWILGHIVFDGPAYLFLENCLEVLLQHGCYLTENLLHAVSRTEGENVRAAIDGLIADLHTLCQALFPPQADMPATDLIYKGVRPAAAGLPALFLSFADDDAPTAHVLRQALQQVGQRCQDETLLDRGSDAWLAALAERLSTAYALVLLAGPQTRDSHWVQIELLGALEKRKPIVVLRRGDSPLPPYLPQRTPVVDYDAARAADFAPLLAALPRLPADLPAERDLALSPALQRRVRELDYMDRLKLAELQHVARYTRLGGASSLRRTPGDLLDLQPVVAKQEYTYQPWREAERDAVETRTFDNAVDELRDIRRAVLLGDPGSGKTTTLYRLAAEQMDVALADRAAAVPLMVKLGSWTAADEPLEAFLQRSLGDLGQDLAALLAEGRALLLLDGLNEIPAGQHAAKYAAVDRFLAQHPQVAAVVSCRVADYPAERALRLDRVTVAPLDPVRIHAFACNYLDEDGAQTLGDDLFWQLAGEEAKETYGRFVAALGDDLQEPFETFWLKETLPDGLTWGWELLPNSNSYWEDWLRRRERPSSLLKLATNPYMLYMLVEVYRERDHTLPANRGQLFDWFVQRLLLRERLFMRDAATDAIQRLPAGEALLDGLTTLALEMQTQRAQAGAATLAQTTLPRDAARRFLSETQLYQAASATLLLAGDEVRFAHQLLQEYFAARGMRRRIFEADEGQPRLRAAEIWPPDRWWQPTNWEEATILLAGLSSDDCSAVLDWVADANPEVAARCIVESGAFTPEETKLALRERWLPRLTDLASDPQPQARAAVGRALGLVTLADGTPLDNRPGVGVVVRDGLRLPDIAWGEVVPAGSYSIGGDRDAIDIIEERRVYFTQAYQLAQYPVTYAQFQCFVEAPDFADARWWEGLPEEEEGGYGTTYRLRELSEQAFPFWNHPRETVSWYQAVAFCRWLSDRLGYSVDLPSTVEWEVVARYPDGRFYPFGSTFDVKKANTGEGNHIGRTTAVGIYPNGANETLNVYDMSGNVREWCRNKYDDPDVMAVDRSGAPRAVRGGSWYDPRIFARAAYRYDSLPYLRYFLLGFRVVRRPPSQDD